MMKWLVVLFVALASLAEVSSVVHTVPGYGTLNGTKAPSYPNLRTFYSFRNVKYAEKPTPETRFLPPVAKAPYPDDEVVDARRPTLGCNQFDHAGDEDCLALDVHTPVNLTDVDNIENANLPVLFWIHGGAFSKGQPLEYLPIRLIEEDIVIVVIQYRLGPLGFLSFDTDEVPGNAGLFDQIEALRWVQKYIRFFGGDPSQVTIAGESAGSASVTLLLLAPQAKGLFARGIAESGSVLAEWALDKDDYGVRSSKRVAEIAGCPLEPYEDLLNCVRTVDAGNLTRAYNAFMKEDIKNGNLGFGASNPVLQRAGKERIIEQNPRLLFESGNYSTNIPILFGANAQEGTLVVSELYTLYLKPLGLLDDELFLAEDTIPLILKALNVRDDTGTIADAMIDKYMRGLQMGNFTSMTPGLIDMTGALFLKAPTFETLSLHSRHQPDSFFYGFNFKGTNSIGFFLFSNQDLPFEYGVCHSDELIYLWAFPFPPTNPDDIIYRFNEQEEATSRRMVRAWTNFVKFGNPTPDGDWILDEVPKWPRYNREQDEYMSIDAEWEVKKDYTSAWTSTVDDMHNNKH